MPNYITNRLVVTANSNEELKDFLSVIKGETEINGKCPSIDFNKIIPMPMALRDTEASSMTDNSIYYYLVKSGQKHLIDKILRYSSLYDMERFANHTEDELADMMKIGEKYVNIFNECGAKDWYDWSIANWGTKWNAFELDTIIAEDTATIYFKTAWSGVPIIISKLTEMFPTITFDYKYADEDMGYNCGEGYGEDGEFSFNALEGGSEEAIETYALCWGCDIDDFYQDDEGCWHNREWEDDEDEVYNEDGQLLHHKGWSLCKG